MKTNAEVQLLKPFTLIEKRNEKQIQILSLTKDRYVQVFRNAISSTPLQQLKQSLNTFSASNKIRHKKRCTRVLHLECWQKSSKEVTVTKDTTDNWSIILAFSQDIKNVIEKASSLFESNYPDLYQLYMNIILPVRLFEPWASCAINLSIDNNGVEYHVNNHYFTNELCWVIPLKNYVGGYFLFFELFLAIKTKPGDIMCFHSKIL